MSLQRVLQLRVQDAERNPTLLDSHTHNPNLDPISPTGPQLSLIKGNHPIAFLRTK